MSPYFANYNATLFSCRFFHSIINLYLSPKLVRNRFIQLWNILTFTVLAHSLFSTNLFEQFDFLKNSNIFGVNLEEINYNFMTISHCICSCKSTINKRTVWEIDRKKKPASNGKGCCGEKHCHITGLLQIYILLILFYFRACGKGFIRFLFLPTGKYNRNNNSWITFFYYLFIVLSQTVKKYSHAMCWAECD